MSASSSSEERAKGLESLIEQILPESDKVSFSSRKRQRSESVSSIESREDAMMLSLPIGDNRNVVTRQDLRQYHAVQESQPSQTEWPEVAYDQNAPVYAYALPRSSNRGRDEIVVSTASPSPCRPGASLLL